MTAVYNEGLTLLSPGDSANGNQRNLNVILLHGLRGHPLTTWSCPRPAQTGDQNNSATTATTDKRRDLGNPFSSKKGKNKGSATRHTSTVTASDIFWPKELLVPDLSRARVWTYGYNANVHDGLFQPHNQNSISQHGRNLAVRLERDIDNRDPIVFVAHGLGGIITKDALHKSEAILARTRMIVFLGTPHRGSPYAGWGQTATNMAMLSMQDSNKQLVHALEVNSEVLDNIHEAFKTILSRHDIKIHSFQEGKGISGMIGLHNKVVDDFSSKLDLAREQETVETIDGANHMEMVRCTGRDDMRYRQIFGVLRSFTENLHAASESSLRRSNWQNELREILKGNFQLLDKEPPFQFQIQPCDWLQDLSQYSWVTDPRSGILWIIGPPGCGKSVLHGQIITRLKSERQAIELHFTCNSQYERASMPVNIVSAIVWQLTELFPQLVDSVQPSVGGQQNHPEPTRQHY